MEVSFEACKGCRVRRCSPARWRSDTSSRDNIRCIAIPRSEPDRLRARLIPRHQGCGRSDVPGKRRQPLQLMHALRAAGPRRLEGASRSQGLNAPGGWLLALHVPRREAEACSSRVCVKLCVAAKGIHRHVQTRDTQLLVGVPPIVCRTSKARRSPPPGSPRASPHTRSGSCTASHPEPPAQQVAISSSDLSP
jgi:hypothetical protein